MVTYTKVVIEFIATVIYLFPLKGEYGCRKNLKAVNIINV